MKLSRRLDSAVLSSGSSRSRYSGMERGGRRRLIKYTAAAENIKNEQYVRAMAEATEEMDEKLRTIFRSYDIRGKIKDEITPGVMERIGKAYGTVVQQSGQTSKIVVGRDSRTTSERLAESFMEGVASTGVEKVIEIGLEPKGVAMFHAWRNNTQAVYITASHLPPEWNGVKFYHPSGVGYLEREIERIADVFFGQRFETGESEKVERDVRGDYLDYLTSQIDMVDSRINILLDCGNGVAGLTGPQILAKLGFSVDTLYAEPDGTFPNRESDVTHEALTKIRSKVQNGYQLGIAFDGDADRCALITPSGRLLDADETAYLVLDRFLENRTGTIVANVECSRLIDDVAERHNCTVERVRVGHTYLVKKIVEEGGLFGVEKSGHFVVPHLFPLDDGVAAALFFASTLSGVNIDAELVEMPEYYGDRISFECPDSKKFRVVERLEDRYVGEYSETSTVDGIRVELSEGWVLIRASNTSEKIRLTIEAETEDAFKKLKEEFSADLEQEIERA